jgi:hypothetical protein
VFSELRVLRYLIVMLRTRWQLLRAQPEAGYSTEMVIVTALLVALAVAAVAIIAAKVLSKANSISTGG